MSIGVGESLETIWGRRLKESRKARDWTQEQLSERAEVAQNTISNIERGARAPSDRMKVKLADALGTPVFRLFPWPGQVGEDDVA